MSELQTLPQFFLQNCKQYRGNRTAMREKDRGIWKSYSWQDYYDRVKHLSLFLRKMDLSPGGKVALLGENKPEIYWAELAAQAAGAASVGIFSDCGAEEVKFFVNHADVTFLFVHDQEQVDKVLDVKNEMPQLKKAIYWDPKGLWNYRDPLLMSMEEAMAMGQDYEKEHPDLFEDMISRGKAEDIAVIIFTSGTTGKPKAAMLSQGGLVSAAKGFVQVDGYGPQDNYLSFVPVAWITEQLIGVAGSIFSGFVVNFPESAETVSENIRELGATILFFSPRQWESINRMIQSKILDTNRIKRQVYNFFVPIALKAYDNRFKRQKAGLCLKLLHGLGRWLVLRNLRDNLGLSFLRVGYTAGSAVSPDILRFFQAIGINIKQIYGSSEMGLVTAHRNGMIRPETSGNPLPGVQVRLSQEGEIQVRNPGMFAGYYKDEESFHKKFRDGWYCSGDYGHIDEEGQLIVIDRMEDLRSLGNGRKFSPQYPEVRLRFSPYIKEVLVVGEEKHKYPCCLVNIDLDNVGRWAEANQIAYTTFADLSQKPEVVELIREEIRNVNKSLPEEGRLVRFLNMVKEFDADEAELTRTRKLRRSFLEGRYQDLIEGLYSGQDEVEVRMVIEYRDGRKGTMTRKVKICNL
jgi:long-chain acyl-CoA synthetase